MAWLILFVAGLFETCWAIGLKYTDQFTRLWPSLFVVVTMGISLFLLSVAMKTIPVGTAYAVWTGIGAVGAVAVGMVWLGEPITAARVFCLALILAGILGLRFAGGH